MSKKQPQKSPGKQPAPAPQKGPAPKQSPKQSQPTPKQSGPKQQARIGRTGPNNRFQAQTKKPRPTFIKPPKRTHQGPKPNIPPRWEVSTAEQDEKRKRWAQFAGFLAKPSSYSSAYKSQLQKLDSLGAINLKKITRNQWPTSVPTNFIALIAFSPYEGLDGELSPSKTSVDIVGSAVSVAESFISKGYRVVYIQDATSKEYMQWFDFILEEVEREVVVYFSGYAKKFIDYSFDPSGELEHILVFYNGERKGGARKILPDTGLTEDSLTEDVLFDNIARLDYTESTRVIFLHDLYYEDSIFADITEPLPAKLPERVPPPPNTITLELCVDLDALGKASTTGAKGKGPAKAKDRTSSFADLLVKQIKEKPKGTVKDFWDAYTRQVKGAAGITVDSLIGQTPANLFGSLLIENLDGKTQETSITEVNQTLTQLGPTAQLAELPPEEVLTEVEIEAAQKRWDTFVAEMKKPAAYTSMYKAYLAQLDAMGCINLDRITRDQIPDIRIDRCAALFICPYEGLAHTLELGPINDAVTMATLFIARGYKVVYLCDGTPKEYYTWMDWILDNVYYEIVSYFSGHGTQVVNTMGKEADGLSELLVFYDESKKKDSAGSKIKAQQGITEMTISDDLMHSLIISKEYPETRIILISDCCHSGTMFNFDYPIDPSLEVDKPPLNVVCIGAAKDEQTAKQTVMGGKESGVFTYNFSQLITKTKNASFVDLEAYMKKNIAKYQDIVLTTSHADLLKNPIVIDAHDNVT